MYCPKCGQGMFIKKEILDKEFRCVDEDCFVLLRVYKNDDGVLELIEIKEGCSE